jgi:glutamate--cysteine ligase/glutathione synthase
MQREYEQLELSTQIVINEAQKRGVKVEVLDWDENFIRLIKENKVEYIKQGTKTSLDNYVVPLIMENKELTKLILREHDINVPDSVTVKNLDDGLVMYSDFENKDIVIKPKSANFGEGVLIIKNLKSKEVYANAIIDAFNYSKDVLIEDYVAGEEYRFLVVTDEVLAVMYRVPANVKGDGIHNIQELIDEKNQDPRRGKGYITPLEKIEIGPIERHNLNAQNIDVNHVPKQGEVVYLRENSNLSTGGDSIDFTDGVHEEYKQIAIKSAEAVEAKICGVDIIIPDVKAKPNKNNHSIIELNFNPVIYPHNFPYIGQNRNVEKKILDLLKF